MIRPPLNLLSLVFLLTFSLISQAAEIFWVDVRTAEEFNKGHVSEAINIPYEEIVDRIPEVSQDRDALIYLYCRSGRRADIAKTALEELGYSRVINLETLEKAEERAAELSTR
jgi:rhodanese-related sulfurtransferase